MTVLVAIRLWGAAWSRHKLLIECDNQNSVHAINTGMSHDLLMQKILYNLHLECSLKSVEVRAVFVFGCVNMRADCLSRFHLHENFCKKFCALTAHLDLKECTVTPEIFALQEL